VWSPERTLAVDTQVTRLDTPGGRLDTPGRATRHPGRAAGRPGRATRHASEAIRCPSKTSLDSNWRQLGKECPSVAPDAYLGLVVSLFPVFLATQLGQSMTMVA
jgi:hypothetical protein